MTEEIRSEIGSAGPIPFERFMELALYGAEGFYTRPDGGFAGRRGDFITSPEVGPLFGAVIARFLDSEWQRLGRPDRFDVIDLGAGPGTLARSVITAAPHCLDAMRYTAIEVSASQRDRHPEGVRSVASLDELDDSLPFDGVVIANELLDNLPFRLAVFDAQWREAFVDVDRDGRFVELLSVPLDPLPEGLPPTAPHGARAPIVARAAALVSDVRGRLRAGSFVMIDYAVARTTELALRPYREWLRTYRDNDRGSHYLVEAGSQDITIEVPIDQLGEPDALRTQSQFLQRWGIEDLVDEGRAFWEAHAARPGLDAMRMRSRIRESEALLDPAGLGAFLVAEWTA